MKHKVLIQYDLEVYECNADGECYKKIPVSKIPNLKNSGLIQIEGQNLDDAIAKTRSRFGISN